MKDVMFWSGSVSAVPSLLGTSCVSFSAVDSDLKIEKKTLL